MSKAKRIRLKVVEAMLIGLSDAMRPLLNEWIELRKELGIKNE